VDDIDRAASGRGRHRWPRRARSPGSPPRPGAGIPDGGLLYLRSLGRTVRAVDALHHPLVTGVVVEDACWCAGLEDWRSHRPPFWRLGALRRWRDQGRDLARKRERIRALAASTPPLSLG
jgi:hypothetical protein